MSDMQQKVGQKLRGNECRDAIHVGIEPVQAAEQLFPGEWVGYLRNGQVSPKAKKLIGIVDPFLPPGETIRPLEYVFIMPKPGSVTSMRHEWTHPDFDALDDKDDGAVDNYEKAARDVADMCGISYEQLIRSAHKWVEYREWTHMGSNTSYETVPDNLWAMFWMHFERVSGREVDESLKTGTFFICAC